MTIKHYDYKILRGVKRKTLHFGRRSIYDIIKDSRLDFGDKVDYIRHHYVYYEGNYEYFHDSNGKSNENKEKLNDLICSIINKTADPCELKAWNKKIMSWRKIKLIEKKQKEEEKIKNFDDRVIKNNYELKVNLWFAKRLDAYSFDKLSLIRKYLLAHRDEYNDEELETLRYKFLKKISSAWKRKLEQSKENGDINATTL